MCTVTEHNAVKLYFLYLIQCLDGTDDSNPVLAEQCEETLEFRMQEHRELINVNKIFDTLIFRPFSEPTDLFFFLGEKTGILDFKRLRMQAEADARTQKYKEEKHYEITLSDIWSWLENEIGVTKEQGMQMEQALEIHLCIRCLHSCGNMGSGS